MAVDFVAIDFETANAEKVSVIALGLVVVENARIVERKKWLVRPPDGTRFDLRLTKKVHGIKLSDVENEKTFSDLWPEIRSYLVDRVVVAHSAASSEVSNLRSSFDYYEIDPPAFLYACTRDLAKACWPEISGGFGLENVASVLGISYEPHDPVEDARACAEVVVEACRQQGVDFVGGLVESLGSELQEFTMEPRGQQGFAVSGFLTSGDIHPDVQPFDGFDMNGVMEKCSDEGRFDRGEKLFAEGAVQVTRRTFKSWEAKVKASGSGIYDVSVDRMLESKCTCPDWRNNSSRFCKHAVALALAWLDAGGPPSGEDLTPVEQVELMVEDLEPADCKMVLEKIGKHDPGIVLRTVVELFSDHMDH